MGIVAAYRPSLINCFWLQPSGFIQLLKAGPSNQVQPSSTRVIEQLVEDLLDVSNVARLPHDLYKLDLVNALHLEKCDETDGIRIRAELIKFWEYNNLLDGIFKQSFACHRYII